MTAFSDVFKFLDRQSIKVLIDPDSDTVFDSKVKESVQEMILSNESNEILLFFAGKGLKHLHDHDEKTKIGLEKLKQRFDFCFSPTPAIVGLKAMHLDEQISFFCHELFTQI